MGIFHSIYTNMIVADDLGTVSTSDNDILSWHLMKSPTLEICDWPIALKFDRHLTAVLPRCLSYFKAIQLFKQPISRLQDFMRSYDKTSYWILKRALALLSPDCPQAEMEHCRSALGEEWQRCQSLNSGIDWPCRIEYRPWFNIKMPSYQYRKSHCGDKTVVRSSYVHNWNSYTNKTVSLYWIRARSLPSPRKTFNYLCHLTVDKW